NASALFLLAPLFASFQLKSPSGYPVASYKNVSETNKIHKNIKVIK
ncbi:unnamed protein product, partial [marine sediment metagenome]